MGSLGRTVGGCVATWGYKTMASSGAGRWQTAKENAKKSWKSIKAFVKH